MTGSARFSAFFINLRVAREKCRGQRQLGVGENAEFDLLLYLAAHRGRVVPSLGRDPQLAALGHDGQPVARPGDRRLRADLVSVQRHRPGRL